MSCVFCEFDEQRMIATNASFYAIWDIRPVSRGHALVVSKRHVTDFFGLNPTEMSDLHAITSHVKGIIDAMHAPTGCNLAVNCGRDAGQTVFHFHLHIIPRYKRADEVQPDFLGREFPKELQ